MDNKKFEQLIDLIINENEEQARELFHDIVVEKSREIYESIMDEEMMENGMVGQVGDLMDEISSEEAGGMTEEEEDVGGEEEFGDEDEVVDIDAEEFGDEGDDAVEDAVIRIEDKLDQLMAEFEDIMGGDDGDEDFGGDDADVAGEEDFAADEEGEEMMEASDDEEDEEDDLEESVMEAVQLKQVGGSTYNTYGKMGDNGAQTKSPSLQNSGQAGMDSKPVKFSGQSESVPNSPKNPTNYGTKGETQVKGAGSFKNAPGAGNFKEKGESTPKPVTKDAAGSIKSPVAESRKTTKRIVR